MEFNPELDYKLLVAVPLIPLIGYAVQIFFGRFLPRKGDWMLISGMFIVMCITVFLFAKAHVSGTQELGFFHESIKEGGLRYGWLYGADSGKPAALNLIAGILYDPLGATMLAAVGIISFFIHLFSSGYMHGDRRYHIFFANISLFTFAMLGLVLADNLLFLFVFWEVMGLMSYLLIGHFSHDPDSPRISHAAAACKKAFLTTRVGDTCLLFGMCMFYAHFQTFNLPELWKASQEAAAANGGEYPAWMTVAGLFLLGGTVGKSAQFPLHIWLPDAMEGPTPVSAMIHAATMVAAGVFLLGRAYPMLSPEVLATATVIGAFTALFAATIGCTVNDIKGVLAYSTISQLGFMVAAIGLGGLGLIAGLFHMVTHAFFKACLFLCAGSVIHGCHHVQDMQKMGGLRKKMPVTFACMLVCTLAIAGMPLFSGFYSKDRILQAAFEARYTVFSGVNVFAILALAFAAMLTTFYMFRLIFLTFFGEPRDQHVHEHAHESPLPMTLSLVVLAGFGLLGGHFWLAGDPLSSGGTWFTRLVSIPSLYPNLAGADGSVALANTSLVSEHAHHAAHTWAVATSLTVFALGLFAAVWIYLLKRLDPGKITARLGEVYVAVAHKYYIDELVNLSVIKGTMFLARVQKWIDEWIVDGLVNLVGRVSKGLGFFSAGFDRLVVDGAVNAVGSTTQAFGSVARLFQTGRIQQYVSFAVAGGLLAAAVLVLF